MSAREPVSEARVRAVLEEALGDGRLSGVGAGIKLLPSGVVTSIELVSVLVDRVAGGCVAGASRSMGAPWRRGRPAFARVRPGAGW